MCFRIPALVIGILSLAASSVNAANSAALHWTRTDSFTSPNQAVGKAIGSDDAGNVYVAGRVGGDYDFGGGVLPATGGDDVFIARYSASGEHQWSKRFGSSYTLSITGLAVRPGGDSWITGYFQGTVNFGGSNLTTNTSVPDIFVARFSSVGGHLWSARFGDSGSQRSSSVVVDGQGNCYLTGVFEGTVNFGGGNLVSAGGQDIFLASLDIYGQQRWSQRFGTADGYEDAQRLGIDQNANTAIVGSLDDPMSFGGAVLPGGAAAGASPYIAKFNAGGVHQWSHSYPAQWWAYASAVDFDMSGNVVFAGQNQQGPLDFGGGALQAGFFLVKLSPLGVHQWSQRFPATSAGDGTPTSVSIDPTGHIVLTGRCLESGIDLGGGVLANDLFVGRFLPDGSHYWSSAMDGGSLSSTNSSFAAADNMGNVLLTGWYSGRSGANIFSDPNLDETIVARLGANPAEPAIDDILDVGNDQGRQVRITFRQSGADATGATDPVVQYEAFRRVDPLPSTASAHRLTPPGDWEFVGSVPAHEDETYRMIVATLADSTITEGPYLSTFFVRAATSTPGLFFDSEIGSGYSLDNLAPGVPLNLVYDTGGLSWDESSATDFDFFTVYGSNTDSFGAAVVVDYSVAAAMDVSGSPYAYYFVTATDFSGNEGQPAKINTFSGAGGTPTSYVLSISNHPNPFNPRTTVSYTVPARGAVTVEVYDASGARVATLLDQVDRSRGAYSLEWDGRGAGGTMAGSGIYFARIEHASGVKTRKMVLIK